MAKDKAKKKQPTMDDMLDYQYMSVVDEIKYYQAELERADKKAKKKAMKKFKGDKFYPFEYQLAAREQVITEMEGSSLLDKCVRIFHEIKPIVKMISRLIASLIVAILKISAIKGRIKKPTLAKLESVYTLAMQV